jgi:hypothetical protein
MKGKHMKKVSIVLARLAASPLFRKLFSILAILFLAVRFAGATGSEDPNETLVDGSVATLTTTFATVFALGLGVVIAMIAKKYLRKAS